MNLRIASRFGTKDLGVCCVELSIPGENGAEIAERLALAEYECGGFLFR
jgi:hypothetical protein